MEKNVRVQIAEDVIAALDAGKITAHRGHWALYNVDQTVDDNEELQNVLNRTQCSVCALGAVFTEMVRRDNHFKVGELSSRRYLFIASLEERLETVFSRDQIILIENAYECGRGFYKNLKASEFFSEEVLQRQDAFISRYCESTDEVRMKVIMQNIIENNGEFIP